MKNLVKRIPVLFLIFFLCCTVLLAPSTGKAASAASPASLDETDVLDDLEGSTLNGKPFDKADFTVNEIRRPQIIAFVEFGYSFYAARQGEFGLYVYVYNPYAAAFDDDPERNAVVMQAGEGPVDSYGLKLINYSTDKGYEGIFYKFKIVLSDFQQSTLLSGLSRERVYKVTELELIIEGAPYMYPCATVYTYTGYAKGYGPELAGDEDTLTCTVDGFEEYLELDVRQTVYRPKTNFPNDGNREDQLYNGNQPQINSCYFRVPSKYFLQYGELTRTVAEWWEYYTKPIFVCTDPKIYRELSVLKGRPVEDLLQTGKDVFIQSWGNEYFVSPAQWRRTPFMWASTLEQDIIEAEDGGYMIQTGDAYSLFWPSGAGDKMTIREWRDQRFSNLAGVIPAIGSLYYNASIDSARIKQELLANSASLGGPYYAGRYSQALFESYITDTEHQMGYNKVEIDLKKTADVIYNETKATGLGYFGSGDLDPEPYPIEVQRGITVQAADLVGTDQEIADRLFVAKGDVPDLKDQFNKAKLAGEQLILLRYAISNYHSGKAIAFTMDRPKVPEGLEAIPSFYERWRNSLDDTLIHAWMEEYHAGNINGYLAQETVFLDFDIISLWFETVDAKTEIPVMMSPQDVIGGLDPAVSDDPGVTAATGLPWYIWLAIILILIIALIVLSVLFPVLKPIFAAIAKAVMAIVLAPFKFIAWIAKQISESVKRRRETKARDKPSDKPKKQSAARKKAAPNTSAKGGGYGTGKEE